MHFSVLVTLIAAVAVSASALPARNTCTYQCPPTADNGADALANEVDGTDSISCSYYYGSGPLKGPGHGPVLPSCDYDSTTGALTGSNVFTSSECPSEAVCFLGTLPPKMA